MKKYKKKYTYIPPEEIPSMSQEELLKRCSWLINWCATKYWTDKSSLKDAKQIASMVVLNKQPAFDPSRNVNFEGWVKVYIQNALVQGSLNHCCPVSFPEKQFRIGKFPRPVSVHFGYESQESEGCDENACTDGFDVPVSIVPTAPETITLYEREELLDSLHSKVFAAIDNLPEDERQKALTYLSASKFQQGTKKHREGRMAVRRIAASMKAEANLLFGELT